MSNSLMQMKESVLASFFDVMNHVVGFMPTMLGALVLLVFGWVLSHYVGKFVRLMLTKVGFEKASLRSGFHTFLQQSGTRTTASHLTGHLCKWFVRLIFIQAAASVLGMPQVTQVINSIILFIPKVIVAMVILVAGSLVSHFLSQAVRGSTSKIGGANPAMVAKLTRWMIMGFAVISAISQLEIAENIVNTLFMGFTGSVALAFGLAFGLGGRDTAAEICKTWLRRSQQEDRSTHIRKAG
jgi:hypothetical protein